MTVDWNMLWLCSLCGLLCVFDCVCCLVCVRLCILFGVCACGLDMCLSTRHGASFKHHHELKWMG